MFRDPLSILSRDAKAMTAPAFPTRVDVSLRPRRTARFEDGAVEILTDTLRVVVRDLRAADAVPARGVLRATAAAV